MKTIKLNRGFESIVDDDDYDRVSALRWHARVNRRADGTLRVYAFRVHIDDDGSRHALFLHRYIMPVPNGMDIDHVNGDGLDNRRGNLRCATRAENNYNSRKRSGGTSIYRGVSWHGPCKKWHARFSINGKSKYLGVYESEELAAAAYNKEAEKHAGQFATLNKIMEVS